jgi:hypothetical protein
MLHNQLLGHPRPLPTMKADRKEEGTTGTPNVSKQFLGLCCSVRVRCTSSSSTVTKRPKSQAPLPVKDGPDSDRMIAAVIDLV